MVPVPSHKVSRVSWYSGYRLVSWDFAYGAFTLSRWSFQGHSAILKESIIRSEPRSARTPVWALPRSLAATYGITFVFSSSGYLDVSVHRVPSVWLWIRHTVTGSASRVSPFRYPRIPACLRLPVAFRSLSRLSSAIGTEAFSLRS